MTITQEWWTLLIYMAVITYTIPFEWQTEVVHTFTMMIYDIHYLWIAPNKQQLMEWTFA